MEEKDKNILSTEGEGLPTPIDKTKKLLEDLEGIDSDDIAIKPQESPKKKFKNSILYGVFVLFVMVVIAVVAVFLPKSAVFNNGNKDKVQETTIEDVVDNRYRNSRYPFDVPLWARVSYDDSYREKHKNYIPDVLSWSEFNILGPTVSSMPSESEGYTSDVKQALKEDGTINMNYSYVLKEDVSYAVSVYTQRLINPTFGNWFDYQRSPVVDNIMDKFSDMFTDNWKEKNKDAKNLPILVDWVGDSFGGLKFSDDGEVLPYFYGDVVRANSRGELKVQPFNVDDEGGAYGYNISLPIKFTSFSDTPGKLNEKDGVLNFKLVPNTNENADRNHRLLIDESSLVI